MNNQNSIGIHIIGLDDKESAVFNRVIAFNVTHGLIKHDCSNAKSADLIILSENHFAEYAKNTENSENIDNKSLLIVSNDNNCQLGDFQSTRPLLITRVMKTLQQAIDLASLKSTSKNNESESSNTPNTILDSSTVEETAVKSPVINSVAVENTASIKTPQSNHHALVIDDSAAIRKQLELELRDAGISADFAESGEQALKMIKSTQYDLIFLDIIMPGIDGYETCKTMRSITDYKKTPIIMLSGKTSPLDEVQGVIAGATTYLTKPVKSDKLQETLNRVTKWLENFNTETKKQKTEAA